MFAVGAAWAAEIMTPMSPCYRKLPFIINKSVKIARMYNEQLKDVKFGGNWDSSCF